MLGICEEETANGLGPVRHVGSPDSGPCQGDRGPRRTCRSPTLQTPAGAQGAPGHRDIAGIPWMWWQQALCPCFKLTWPHLTCLSGDSYPAGSACFKCAKGERPGRHPLCGTRGLARRQPARLSPEPPARATPGTRVSVTAETVLWATVIRGPQGCSKILESARSDLTSISFFASRQIWL